MESRVLESGKTGVYKRAWLSCRVTSRRLTFLRTNRATDIRVVQGQPKPSPPPIPLFFFSPALLPFLPGQHHLPREYHLRLTLASPMLDALISLEPARIISTVVSAHRCSKFNAATFFQCEKETSTKDLARLSLVYVRPIECFLMAIRRPFRDIRLTIIREILLGARVCTCVCMEVLSSTFKATSLNLDRVGRSNRKSELSASARTAFCRKPFAKLRPRSLARA